MRAALRNRRRQYEARARLEEVRLAEEALRRANETLEERVADRTRALRDANALLVEQMAERERVEGQLRQSQKVEAIGQLTGGVAHDFNNLLMSVLGNLALLRKRLPADDPRIQRLIDGAVEGAQCGAALTQRLRAFARRQELRPAPAPICMASSRAWQASCAAPSGRGSSCGSRRRQGCRPRWSM